MEKRNYFHKNVGRLKYDNTINVHNGLISALKTQIPSGENPANMLKDLLSISKEGAYRRLRGEIQLTLEEAIILAKKLEISIDNLIETNGEDKKTFHIYLFEKDSYTEEYHKMLIDIMNSYLYIKSDPECYNYYVGKIFPLILYFKYKEFSKFAFFKWIYLVRGNIKYTTFADLNVTPELENLRQPFMDAAMEIPTTYILNDDMFTSIAKDLKYYYTIKLLTKEDTEILKEQILMLIDDMEEIAVKGMYKTGAKVSIYVTESYFDITYTHIKGNGIEACGIGIYGLNFLSCMNKQIVNNHKTWIESLIKYSTLISQSGESKRITFFNRQREKINNIVI